MGFPEHLPHPAIGKNGVAHLPQMAHNGRVRPGVLCVHSYLAVFEDNKREGLVKPPTEENAIRVSRAASTPKPQSRVSFCIDQWLPPTPDSSPGFYTPARR